MTYRPFGRGILDQDETGVAKGLLHDAGFRAIIACGRACVSLPSTREMKIVIVYNDGET
jgi:hypothetical protein